METHEQPSDGQSRDAADSLNPGLNGKQQRELLKVREREREREQYADRSEWSNLSETETVKISLDSF